MSAALNYTFSMQAEQDRPENELIGFTIAALVLLIVRFVTLIYFTVQTMRYVRLSKKKNGSINLYIMGTFICLNLSFIGFFLYDCLAIFISFAKFAAKD
jgi:hypothetical protein